MTSFAPDTPIDLRFVTVRPTYGANEHRLWDRLVTEHHYLGSHGIIGKGLRHVALFGETWLALIGWQPGAFKLAARDRWIGWSPEQQFRRLHLIGNNSRFVILTPQPVPNLASRILGLSLRRLSADIQATHGYPVFLAETFVDISKFKGTCYRAANWHSLGLTRGFSRQPGVIARFHHHGQPKEIFLYDLSNGNASKALSQDEIPDHWKTGPDQKTEPMATPKLRSLFELLSQINDFRKPRGIRYQLNTILTIAVAARIAGYRGVTAFAEFAKLFSQEQLKAVGSFFSPSRQCYTTPVASTFHYIFSLLPPEALDQAVSQWNRQQVPQEEPIAMDGKDVRGASKQTEDGSRMMVAAFTHGTGVVLGQTEVDSKTNEITAVRELTRTIDVAGRVVTLDALHAQQETVKGLLERQADYVITAIKENQPTMLQDLKDINYEQAPAYETLDKSHGRIEHRYCKVVDLTDAKWNSYATLHGRRQAIRIRRVRIKIKQGVMSKPSEEITYALTSLGPEQAGPKELLKLVREHWSIENRLHYVRDFSYDEDRCRAHVKQLPRNLACLSNIAISIIRCNKKFQGKSIPEANRYLSNRHHEAIDAVLNPPGS